MNTIANPSPHFPFPIRLAYVFTKGVWLENIAVRPNGQLLLTRLDVPELYLLDLQIRDPWPILVYRFPDALALTGIAEIAPDVFVVGAGNYTLAEGPTAGSWAVWRVDLSHWNTTSSGHAAANSNFYLTSLSHVNAGTVTLGASQVSKVADVPEVAWLKDITRLSDRYVLLSDLHAGVIYRLDVTTGAYTVVIANDLTAAIPRPIFGLSGVNGLRVRNGDLYFTNRGQNIFARMPIRADGTPAGLAEIVARTAALTDFFDGFTFGAHGDPYLTTGFGDKVVRLSLSGGPEVLVVGRSLTDEPTACAFGRGVGDQGVLYVVTAGGLARPVQMQKRHGARVVAVEVETGGR